MAHTLFLQLKKMFNLDDITNEHNEEHDLQCLHIPQHPYRMLIIRGYGLGKTTVIFNLIKE